MKNSSRSSDPTVHRERERQIVQHIEKLLDDDRLRIDTTRGRRPVTAFIRDVNRGDRGVELKRLMSEMDKPDRELESQMPRGQSLEVVVSQRSFWLFKKAVGRLRVVCLSPTRALLSGEEPKPMNTAEVTKVLSEMPPPLGGVPTTILLVSTGGFTLEAHEKADRGAERTLILAEPNEAGGWSITGPAETRALAELFDPEADDQKRQRVREYIDKEKIELTGSGIATDQVAARTQLPLQLIEDELKTYARENPGLAAKRLDGRVVLFRQSALPAAGGAEMPLIDRLRGLFSRKGDNEKKVAFLSERRTSLSQQRDRAYEEMSALDGKETELKEQFKTASSTMTKRRITSQMLQLRKDMERRQQLLSILNQQINVVSTHLHNLELVQQGQVAALPNSEEMAADAAAAEEMMAQLEADTELAGSVGSIATGGMSAEEQALFEELERETAGPTSVTERTQAAPSEPAREPASKVAQRSTPAPAAPQAQAQKPRGEAEPG